MRTHVLALAATVILGACGSSPAPSAPTAAQGDVTGTWRYSILSAGARPGWARGTLSVDGAGQVTVSSYLDESGATSAPASFFPVLLVDPPGHVRDAPNAASAHFTGDLGATHKKLIVATAASGGTASIAILQKHDPGVIFSNADVAGWGGGTTGGGARKFVYDQISAGVSPQEWEIAAGQIGQTPDVLYPSFGTTSDAILYLAPSNPIRPASKITTMAVTPDGIVSETIKAGVTGTQPEFLLAGGFLSDDKTMIVAVGLTPNPGAPIPAAGRHALRVYSVTNAGSTASTIDTTTATVADLAGSYACRRLVVGPSPLTASGTLSIDAGGVATFASYADSAGSTAAPAAIPFTMGPDTLGLPGVTQFWGVLSSTADGTLSGKLSYDKDLVVFTHGTAGASAITFALK